MLTLECIICGSSTTPAEPAQATVHAGGGHELGARLGAEADSRGVQGQVRYRRGEGACFDTARLTRHAGVQGRRRRVEGAAADSPSYFSSLWAPGEARSRRRTRVKQAHNGSRRAAVAPGPRAPNTLAPGGKACTAFLHTRCCQPCHCARSGPRARRDGAFCRFMCESGHRNSTSTSFGSRMLTKGCGIVM